MEKSLSRGFPSLRRDISRFAVTSFCLERNYGISLIKRGCTLKLLRIVFLYFWMRGIFSSFISVPIRTERFLILLEEKQFPPFWCTA